MQDSPSLVPSYCGQNQQQTINVPAQVAYKYIDGEEGPWVMIPYSSLYPPDSQAQPPAAASLPPQVSKTDLWSAQQVWPL